MKLVCSIRAPFLTFSALALFISACCAFPTFAQTEDSFGDAAADPIRLFEQGQGAHARGEVEKALEFYQRALQVRPEFPEAEFQRGNVLVSLGRFADAHVAFGRAIELKSVWSLPYSAQGALYVREKKDSEAEKSFRQALARDSKDNLALRMLAELRLRANDPADALALAQRATSEPQVPLSAWIVRAMAERGTGDRKSAHASLARVLEVEPENLPGLLERAELWLADADYERAASDLNVALKGKPEDKQILSRLAFAYERAGKVEEAQRIAQKAGILEVKPVADGTIQVIGTPEEIEAANSDDPTRSQPALEKLLAKNPQNAMLLARLGLSYRIDNPGRSLEYYRRAVEIQPQSGEYASGYAAALVQARRFGDAVTILRRVLTDSPELYAAHANLATALYELKRYDEALGEYEWLLKAKPENSIAYYFIATSHDNLGEYPEALKAYETFLVHADPKTNQLEIDKIRLRLPTLKKQIQLGQGVKRKKSER